MSNPIDFDPNTPEFPGDSFAVTQEQLQENFQFLYNAFKMNHIPLDASSALGNHTVVQLAEQENDQQSGANELAIYAKDDSTQTDQLFLRNQNGTVIPLTTYQIYKLAGMPGVQDQFFTFLPGRIIVYFGVIKTLNAQTPLQLNPPVATKIFSMSFTGLGSSSGAQIKPNVYIPDSEDEIYRQILVQGNATPSGNIYYYYIILANIVSAPP